MFRLSRLNPNRRPEFAPAKFQFDHIAILDFFLRCQLRTDERRIFPGQFREWSRKFL